MISVLSYNSGTFGHASYQQCLEQYFASRANPNDLLFESTMLTRPGVGSLRSRVFWRVLGRRWPWGRRSDVDDHDFYRLRSEWLSSWHLLTRFKARIGTNSVPDVLHLHTQGIALAIAGFSHWAGPTVVSIDNTAALLSRDNPAKIRSSLKGLKHLEKRCFDRATHVVCWSQRAAISLVDDYNIAIKKVSVIRPTSYPMFFNHFAELDRQCRRQARRDSLLKLLFIGNDFDRKGGPELISAFREKLVGKYTLDIVSNDFLSLPQIDGLRHLRKVAHASPEWVSLLENADVFVLPTREDCLGLAFIEAMTAGLPLVGTSVMSVPEMVRHNSNGFCVPPRDAESLATVLVRLHAEHGLRRRLGAESRALAESEFDPQKNGEQLAEVFRRALSSRELTD